MRAAEYSEWRYRWRGDTLKAVWDEIFKTLGFEPHGSDWQADHIVPVVEGGGECDLSNMRTLCTQCHKRETAALRKRLAKPKPEKPSRPPCPDVAVELPFG
jgi:5-methylcytosine-specific restriction endonuclease McrA